MYEPPPGAKKDDKEDNYKTDSKCKFDWQRTWGSAPRESWVAKDEQMNDKPFGIAVKHVKCLKWASMDISIRIRNVPIMER